MGWNYNRAGGPSAFDSACHGCKDRTSSCHKQGMCARYEAAKAADAEERRVKQAFVSSRYARPHTDGKTRMKAAAEKAERAGRRHLA